MGARRPSGRQALAPLCRRGEAYPCTLQFQAFDHDPVNRAYFVSLHSHGADLRGRTLIFLGETTLWVAREPSREVGCPNRYAFQVGLVPEGAAQTLEIVTSGGQTTPWHWPEQRGPRKRGGLKEVSSVVERSRPRA